MLQFYPHQFQRMCEFNQVIGKAARYYNAKVIDLWTNAAEYDSEDLAHANREGMKKIARAVIEEISETGVNEK